MTRHPIAAVIAAVVVWGVSPALLAQGGTSYIERPASTRPAPSAGAAGLPTAAGASSGYPSTGGLSAGGAPDSGAGGPVPVDPNRKLIPGDVVSVEIEEDNRAPRELTVLPTGEVAVWPASKVRVAGLRTEDAARVIRLELLQEYYNKATVRVVLIRTGAEVAPRFSISGNIRSSGSFPLPRGETLMLSRAILQAGGATQFGNLKKVQVSRLGKGGGQVFTRDIDAVLTKGQRDQDLEVMEGDLIYIPAKLFNMTPG